MELILDIKKYIACIDEFVWLNMYIVDDEFKQYACSSVGINHFIKHFIKKDNDGYMIIPILNVRHSIDDLPCRSLKFIYRINDIVVNESYLYREWYDMGVKHRKNDLPAYIDGGEQVWYKRGLITRDNDLPAIMTSDKKVWVVDNYIHRENDLPAIIYNDAGKDTEKDTKKEWYYNGKLHRENDLPAIMDNDRSKHWYYDGMLHRENDLPAKINGSSRKWYHMGKKHRENGLPATVKRNKQVWYCHGVQYHLEYIKRKAQNDINDMPLKKYKYE